MNALIANGSFRTRVRIHDFNLITHLTAGIVLAGLVTWSR
jgi:hypothetical protein